MASKTVVVAGPAKSQVKKIKQEIEDVEDVAQCKVCMKRFASTLALGNHVKMEHMDVYLQGDQTLWYERVLTAEERKAQEQLKIKAKTTEILKAMEPTDVMNLASQDVSYIIIKADSSLIDKKRKEKPKVKAEKPPKPEKQPNVRKVAKPITGPFECLEPKTMAGAGVCRQMFFSCCEYSAHHRDEHTRRRKGLRCQVCEKPLAMPGAEHSPFPCEQCGRPFQNSKDLSDHLAVDHVKIKPYECGVCHKRFTQQGGVQQHMRMHTGDKPFACTFCSKTFTQKSGLDQHLRIHTKVRPYRCIICGKTFSQSVHLKQHMRTHTNVSPFQCGICQKRFKQSSHLNYHLKYHNPATLTEEQKSKYAELIGAYGNREIVQEVEIEVDQNQSELIEQVESIDDQEHMIAAQSIKMEPECGEEYIISDVDVQWTVKMVGENGEHEIVEEGMVDDAMVQAEMIEGEEYIDGEIIEDDEVIEDEVIEDEVVEEEYIDDDDDDDEEDDDT